MIRCSALLLILVIVDVTLSASWYDSGPLPSLPHLYDLKGVKRPEKSRATLRPLPSPFTVKVVFHGRYGSGKSSLISHLMSMSSGERHEIAGSRVGTGAEMSGFTLLATMHTATIGENIMLKAVDTAGFGEEHVRNQEHVLGEIDNAIKLLMDGKESSSVHRIYYVIAYDDRQTVPRIVNNLKALRFAYGDDAAQQIRFIINKCDLCSTAELEHVRRSVMEAFGTVFVNSASEPAKFHRYLFTSSVASLCMLWDDIRSVVRLRDEIQLTRRTTFSSKLSPIKDNITKQLAEMDKRNKQLKYHAEQNEATGKIVTDMSAKLDKLKLKICEYETRRHDRCQSNAVVKMEPEYKEYWKSYRDRMSDQGDLIREYFNRHLVTLKPELTMDEYLLSQGFDEDDLKDETLRKRYQSAFVTEHNLLQNNLVKEKYENAKAGNESVLETCNAVFLDRLEVAIATDLQRFTDQLNFYLNWAA